jgi:hypothetical protein
MMPRLPRLPRRRTKWQRILRHVGSFAWQCALLATGVFTATAITSGTSGTWRMLLAVGTVFVIVAGGQIALPLLGMIVARIANMVITWWRWRRG